MSVQFGKWNYDGQAPEPNYFDKARKMLKPFGPDRNDEYSVGGARIFYGAFCTTKESWLEKQPHISAAGAVITLDGRLDNRKELIRELPGPLTTDSTDVALVAAAYDQWESGCFSRLIGDWAISIWNPQDRSLLLAKDPVGTRGLYYLMDDDSVTWSTVPEPLVLFAGKTFTICEEYISGWFSYRFPSAELTPYCGIYSVPPSSFVLLRSGKRTITKHWELDPAKRVRYRTDAEYEEHFRDAFAQAVQRRLRSDRPVLAELSGGMDSSSIVCMADQVIARGQAECPRLDTISWYDDSYDHLEPDTNELHWIQKVEEKRGARGYRFNLRELQAHDNPRAKQSFDSQFDKSRFAVTPLHAGSLPAQFGPYVAHMKAQGHRVVLSGLGGDDPTGGDGIPSPTAELQDLLATGRFFTLARQASAWAAKMRKPRLPLVWDAIREFLPLGLGGGEARDYRPAPWLHPDFLKRNWHSLSGYQPRITFFGTLPSFQHNVGKLDMERRLQSCGAMHPELSREARFPFHDRDFLQFIYNVPPEQIVRVGQRRSLMKRALAGIVPIELLTRKRKPFVPPEEEKQDSALPWPSVDELGSQIISASLGFIEPDYFLGEIRKAQQGRQSSSHVLQLQRTLRFEAWLRHLIAHGVIRNSSAKEQYGRNAQPLRSRPSRTSPESAPASRSAQQPQGALNSRV